MPGVVSHPLYAFAQNGALAVPDGRSILPVLNSLLSHPRFALKLATKDHHPPDHISFASQHGPTFQPFTSYTTISNPANPAETYRSRLWPDHCVAGTPGNELVPELALDRVDKVILKGTDRRVEMYSAFRSPLRDPPLQTAVSELEGVLRAAGATHVVVCGLAGDYCVKCSAIDSAELGWETYVVQDGTRSVGGEEAWGEACREMEAKGVHVVDSKWVKEVRICVCFAIRFGY